MTWRGEHYESDIDERYFIDDVAAPRPRDCAETPAAADSDEAGHAFQ